MAPVDRPEGWGYVSPHPVTDEEIDSSAVSVADSTTVPSLPSSEVQLSHDQSLLPAACFAGFKQFRGAVSGPGRDGRLFVGYRAAGRPQRDLTELRAGVLAAYRVVAGTFTAFSSGCSWGVFTRTMRAHYRGIATPGAVGGWPRYEPDSQCAQACRDRDDELLWFLRTELALRPRTLELNEFLLRKASGWRSKNCPTLPEVDWHMSLARAVQSLSGGYIEKAYERVMREQGELGIRRINLLCQGQIAPNYTLVERLARLIGFKNWAERRRLSRAVQIIPKTI